MKIENWINKNFNKDADTVLITGGSSGIGKEYLREFAKLGCQCITVSNEESVNENVAKELSIKHNVKIIPITCDLADYNKVNELIEKLKSYNISVLVNNAGFGLKGDFLSIDPDVYNDIIGVNIMAPTILTRSLLGYMREKNTGIVITVASINVVSPIPKNTVYTATKAYLFSYSLALAKENEDYNIVFQTLLPGTTDTAFHVKQGANPSSMTMMPDEVAKGSLRNIDKFIYIPNKLDRMIYPFFVHLPVKTRMKISSYMLKKRLGV